MEPLNYSNWNSGKWTSSWILIHFLQRNHLGSMNHFGNQGLLYSWLVMIWLLSATGMLQDFNFLTS